MSQSLSKTERAAAFAALAPVIPVLAIEDPDDAVPLARTLVEAGLPVVEVTLRTGRALLAMERIAREVPEAVVAAGTVTTPSQIAAVAAAGARMIVTPGASPGLLEALAACDLPAWPGCATVSEAMAAAGHGFTHLKFFPAASSGGIDWLRAVAGPLPMLRFCPTGGIDAASAPGYLALPNVVCVGGSWMVPAAALKARDWPAIASLAAAAAALRPKAP